MAEECVVTDRKLSDIFDEGLTHYEEIINNYESPTNVDVQNKIKESIKLFEDATKLINIAGVFSSNEVFSEIPTSNLKYLLIPACLGSLVSKVESHDRLTVLETAEVYFKDFLKRLQEYEVISKAKIPELEESDETMPKKLDLQQMALERNEKIRKYNEQKQMEEELKKLKSLLEGYDEDVTRKYFEIYLKKLVNVCVDELRSIKQEKPLARHMAERKKNTLVSSQAQESLGDKYVPKPFKPIIITKNEIQKKVFGAGYPSLPVLTVDEFYEQRVAEGIFPAEGSNYGKSLQDLENPDISKAEDEKAEMNKETDIETDNAEALAKARGFDEYKDEHRRGWGNRMNRS